MIPIPGGMTTILGGVLLIAVGGYVLHCEHVKKDRASFIATLEAQAAAQKKENERITKENVSRKEKADAETTKLRTANATLSKRLRDNAGASVLPAPAPGAGSPDRACFGRADLDRALQRFTGGAAELVIQGDEARVGLDVARRWAQ